MLEEGDSQLGPRVVPFFFFFFSPVCAQRRDRAEGLADFGVLSHPGV